MNTTVATANKGGGVEGYLAGFQCITWRPLVANNFTELKVYFGGSNHPLEIALGETTKKPDRAALLEIWKERRRGRAAPVMLVVEHNGKVSMCGPVGDPPTAYFDLDVGGVGRLCNEALTLPDRNAAQRFLAQALSSIETTLPGLNNVGLLALHELQHGVPQRKDWKQAGDYARNAAGKCKEDLLKALGYKIEPLDRLTSVLLGDDHRTALAVVLHDREIPEASADRFNGLSPVSYALQKADEENLDWVLMIQKNKIRLYATKILAGVGHRGRTDTYIECQTSLLSDENLSYLWLLYSADALRKEGSIYEILEGSRRFSGSLAAELRERIYDVVVRTLAEGIVKEYQCGKPTAKDLELIYEMALTIIFRLLFIAYAEDRDLLPYSTCEEYRKHSLKEKAHELRELELKGKCDEEGASHWLEASQLWKAVNKGNEEWDVLEYGGVLFSSDKDISKAGYALEKIELPNKVFSEALKGLLLVQTSEGQLGPVDFRSLGVREFGTVYEGLLESELAIADSDLTLIKKDKDKIYVPAKKGQEVKVAKGGIFLSHRSGARKSTGSYYTKPFAVCHLLDRTLEPALTDHFKQIDKLNDTDAAENFFKFRVADIAMGSGHFMIEAIDRIEKRMAQYLSNRKLAIVRKEVNELRNVATSRLEAFGQEDIAIEDGPLLRRLIAKRCIYGVDINKISVSLARLAVWIHTFVPGLPLTFLDRNLVHGNSLVGVCDFEDLTEKIGMLGHGKLFFEPKNLMPSEDRLRRLAKFNDATPKQISEAQETIAEIEDEMKPTKDLFDLITAAPISINKSVKGFFFEEWERRKGSDSSKEAARLARVELEGLYPLHFPAAFPEVFVGVKGKDAKPKGFDLIFGNPPWNKVKVTENEFWARHFPGLRGLAQRDEERKRRQHKKTRKDLVAQYEKECSEMDRLRLVLSSGGYPGMGTGDSELYKAFCWRFWRLVKREGGRIGVVLPRSALIRQGTGEFRRTVFSEAREVEIAILSNSRHWVFPSVHAQYTTCLVCITKQSFAKEGEGMLLLCGPFTSLSDFEAGTQQPSLEIKLNDIVRWSEEATIPNISNSQSLKVFSKFMKLPSLLSKKIRGGATWKARPDRELDATLQKHLFVDFERDSTIGERDQQTSFMPRQQKS